MIADGSLNFQSVLFEKELWYEIDTVEDLFECEQNFINQALPEVKQKVTQANETTITDQCKLYKNQ